VGFCVGIAIGKMKGFVVGFAEDTRVGCIVEGKEGTTVPADGLNEGLLDGSN